MNPEVNYATLASIARKLDVAADALNECGSSVPDVVDAGELSGVILLMVGAAVHSAGGVAEGLTLAASKVREAVANYTAADDDAVETFARLGR